MIKGMVRCWAKNEIGIQRVPCVFMVTKAGPPASLAGCLVTNKTTTSLTVECIHGDDGGSRQHFHANVYETVYDGDENTNLNHDVSDSFHQPKLKMNLTAEKSATFYLSNLNPGTTYMIELYANNARGQSDLSHLSVTTLFTKNTKLSKCLCVYNILLLLLVYIYTYNFESNILLCVTNVVVMLIFY